MRWGWPTVLATEEMQGHRHTVSCCEDYIEVRCWASLQEDMRCRASLTWPRRHGRAGLSTSRMNHKLMAMPAIAGPSQQSNLFAAIRREAPSPFFSTPDTTSAAVHAVSSSSPILKPQVRCVPLRSSPIPSAFRSIPLTI
jgi:hypothetical protein